jgi:hypothetical protein
MGSKIKATTFDHQSFVRDLPSNIVILWHHKFCYIEIISFDPRVVKASAFVMGVTFLGII